MGPKLSQSLKQTQGLVITPQLQQAIKMLTLTHLEMTNIISEQMVENPMLEESGADNTEKTDTNESIESQNKEAKAEEFNEEPLFNKDDFDWGSYVEHFNSNSGSAPSMVSRDPDDNPNYENMISQTMSLADHLLAQLGTESLSDKQRIVAEELIHNINNDGLLEIELEEVSKNNDIPLAVVKEVIEMIQYLDPVGCGTRSIEETLVLQSLIRGVHGPILEGIIKNHLMDLKNKRFSKIAEALGVSEDNIISVGKVISELNPKPGRLVVVDETHYVVPDIFVVKVGPDFIVQVNDDGVPKLRISNLYKQLLSSKKTGGEAQDYVQDKLKSAMWLIKSIQNRQKTIYRVAKAIVSRQQDFFKKGPSFLKPMILKDIASEIGMHESTVSRVTNNKYMHTPIGLFELKYFFGSAIGGKDGGIEISNEALKIKLKQIIENENPLKPLSDQKLAILLSQEDVKIARRTVAKYREVLGIESSSKRKKRA
jgi:RNA polymerase sigma-54 factor